MVTAGQPPREALAAVERWSGGRGLSRRRLRRPGTVRLATGRDPRLSDRPPPPGRSRRLEEAARRRAAGNRCNTSAGGGPFLTFELAVGPGVLCPRPDTEVVAEEAVRLLEGVDCPRVLDLCAGTGCLGLGVKALRPDAQVTCLEKSPEALAYLRLNARCALAGQPEAPAAWRTCWSRTPLRRRRLWPGWACPAWRRLPSGWRRETSLITGGSFQRTAGPDRVQSPVPHRRRDGNTCSPKRPGSPPWPWPQGRTVWSFTAPSRRITGPRCARRGAGAGDRLAAAPGVTALLEDAGWTAVACRRDYGGNDRCITARAPAEQRMRADFTTYCCNSADLCYTIKERDRDMVLYWKTGKGASGYG